MKRSLWLAMISIFSYDCFVYAHGETEDPSIFPPVCPYELYGTTTTGNDGASDLLGLDPTTGDGITVATISGNGAHRVTGIDFASNGALYGVGQDVNNAWTLFKINCRTGFTFSVGALGTDTSFSITDISFDSNGVLWAYQDKGSNDEVGTIDINTGAYTTVGASGINEGGNGLAFSLADALFQAGKTNLSLIDQGTGAATTVTALTFYPPADTNPRIHAMDVRPVNGIMYVSINDKASGSSSSPENYLGTIDLSTGVVSFLSSPPERAPDNLAGIAFNSNHHGCLP